jgi:GxxExxY protein
MENDERMKQLTHNIIGACIEVHRILGPGLREKMYRDCLCIELELRGLAFEKEKTVFYDYKGHKMESDMRADIIVENSVVLELKSVVQMHPVFEAQLLSYLKVTNIPVGLLINFNVKLLKDGVIRRTLDGLGKPSPNHSFNTQAHAHEHI